MKTIKILFIFSSLFILSNPSQAYKMCSYSGEGKYYGFKISNIADQNLAFSLLSRTVGLHSSINDLSFYSYTNSPGLTKTVVKGYAGNTVSVITEDGEPGTLSIYTYGQNSQEAYVERQDSDQFEGTVTVECNE